MWHKTRISRYLSAWLKTRLISDEPLYSGISASLVPIETRRPLSLAKLLHSESLTSCSESVTGVFTKPESSEQALPTWTLSWQSGLSGLSISTSLGVLTPFKGMLLRHKVCLGFEFSTMQVVLTGREPGELDLFGFCPLEQLLPLAARLDSSASDPQSNEFWDATSFCIGAVTKFFLVSKTPSFPSLMFFFGVSSFTTSGLTSAATLNKKQSPTFALWMVCEVVWLYFSYMWMVKPWTNNAGTYKQCIISHLLWESIPSSMMTGQRWQITKGLLHKQKCIAFITFNNQFWGSADSSLWRLSSGSLLFPVHPTGLGLLPSVCHNITQKMIVNNNELTSFIKRNKPQSECYVTLSTI